MTLVVCLFFQASSLGSCTFEKRELDLQCRSKVRECVCRLFCVHSISCYFSLILAIHCFVNFLVLVWQALVMFNYEEQSKTKRNLVSLQGDDSSENQQKEIVIGTPAILASSSFDCFFQCCLMTDRHTKYWTFNQQRRKWEKILLIDSQSNAFASFRINAFFFCGPGCSGG